MHDTDWHVPAGAQYSRRKQLRGLGPSGDPHSMRAKVLLLYCFFEPSVLVSPVAAGAGRLGGVPGC